LFNSKYPIMLAAMNKVSTVNFAIASKKSGIFPSLSAYNYYYGKNLFDVKQLEKDLHLFNNSTGGNDIIVSVELFDMVTPEFLNLCSKKLFSHIELIDETSHIYKSEISDSPDAFEKNLLKLENIFDFLESCGIKTLFKCLIPDHWEMKHQRIKNIFSGAIIKSSDAAGKVISYQDRKPLILEFIELKENNPNKVFVPTGGIHSSKQINEFLQVGAQIVGVGSYFVAAEECEVSSDVKEKIIKSTITDLSRFDTGQNAIIFSKIEEDDINHSLSLKQGIKNASEGHIYMGSVVDHIQKIRPLKDIVEELVSELV